jgi:hypothetical protein
MIPTSLPPQPLLLSVSILVGALSRMPTVIRRAYVSFFLPPHPLLLSVSILVGALSRMPTVVWRTYGSFFLPPQPLLLGVTCHHSGWRPFAHANFQKANNSTPITAAT